MSHSAIVRHSSGFPATEEFWFFIDPYLLRPLLLNDIPSQV